MCDQPITGANPALATLSAASIQPAVADRLVALTRDATSRNR